MTADMQRELDDYESVVMTDRFARLRSPQLWKSRFRVVPMIVGFVLLQVVVFLIFLWHFRKH